MTNLLLACTGSMLLVAFLLVLLYNDNKKMNKEWAERQKEMDRYYDNFLN